MPAFARRLAGANVPPAPQEDAPDDVVERALIPVFTAVVTGSELAGCADAETPAAAPEAQESAEPALVEQPEPRAVRNRRRAARRLSRRNTSAAMPSEPAPVAEPEAPLALPPSPEPFLPAVIPAAETATVLDAAGKPNRLLSDSSVLKLNTLPEGWNRNDKAMTAPRGWMWADNGKSRFGGGYRQALVRLPQPDTAAAAIALPAAETATVAASRPESRAVPPAA